jgi:hypothetical protein
LLLCCNGLLLGVCGLLLAFQTNVLGLVFAVGAQVFSGADRKGESHRDKSYQSCAQPFTPGRQDRQILDELRGADEKDLRD